MFRRYSLYEREFSGAVYFKLASLTGWNITYARQPERRRNLEREQLSELRNGLITDQLTNKLS